MSAQQTSKWFAVLVLINSLVLALLTWTGGIKDISELWSEAQKRQLEITLTPNKQVLSGEILNLNYTAPASGYLSVWNWTSSGEIKNLIPVHALNNNNHDRQLNVRADTLGGMEQIIMLWTPDNPRHPAQHYYRNDAAFGGAVNILQAAEKRAARVYVYNKPFKSS